MLLATRCLYAYSQNTIYSILSDFLIKQEVFKSTKLFESYNPQRHLTVMINYYKQTNMLIKMVLYNYLLINSLLIRDLKFEISAHSTNPSLVLGKMIPYFLILSVHIRILRGLSKKASSFIDIIFSSNPRS